MDDDPTVQLGNWATRQLFVLFLATSLLASPRPRLRDHGLTTGILPPGARNAITDVAGVRVGHETLHDDAKGIHTGVTIVLPHERNLFREKVPAAVFVGNGFGKLVGFTQIEELGEMESPIALTSTLNVPRVADALIDHMLALPGNEDVRSINVVVGETNDGRLNDIRSRPVRAEHVHTALRRALASDGSVEEGSIGAGAGTIAFGFKGGIGTASRKLPAKLGGWTVGVLVQSNYGGVLQINGAPVGQKLGRYSFEKELNVDDGTGSIMIVIATDAPVDARNLKRMGARAIMGLARTGASGSDGSGDYAIAFSTVRNAASLLRNDQMSPLFLATIEATEEAIHNSIFTATTVGNVEALPLQKVLPLLRRE